MLNVLLCIFIGGASFAGSLAVPSSWEHGCVFEKECPIWTVQNPALLGLSKLSVDYQIECDVVSIESVHGVSLCCRVNRQPVRDGGVIFHIVVTNAAGCQKHGTVYSTPGRSLLGGVTLLSSYDKTVGPKVVFEQMESHANYCKYNVEEDCLSVRKFFGNSFDSSEYFVRIILTYNDLKNVQVLCGKRGYAWLGEGCPVGVLTFNL